MRVVLVLNLLLIGGLVAVGLSAHSLGALAGQILFAGLTSSGWLDQAPLVALRIEEDLESPGSVAVDAAYPLGTKGLGLRGGFSDV